MRIEPISSLKHQPSELLSEVARTGRPILITQQGVPSAYLIDVATYERLQLFEGIASGERAAQQARTLSHEEAKSRMSRWRP